MAETDIKGKSVLVTGGASGLGALYAEAFLKEGAAVSTPFVSFNTHSSHLFQFYSEIYIFFSVVSTNIFRVDDTVARNCAFILLKKYLKHSVIPINNYILNAE